MQEKKRIQMTDICDTLLARDWKDPKCVPVEEEPKVKQIGNVCPTKTRSNPNQGRVYDKEGLSPALTTMEGGNREPMIIEQEPFIVASRGRNPENPSDRTTGTPTEQRLEPNFTGCTNTLTSVQKDNYVAEPIVCEERRDEGIRLFKDDCVGTLRTIDACGDKRVLEPTRIKWRIRKLVPMECWKLMPFTREDHDRAAKYVSNSALYKQAGNSIIVNVLVSLMSSLFLEDGHKAEVWTKYALNPNE
jgi:DNA (cytosine-5)-methyltransferase 1